MKNVIFEKLKKEFNLDNDLNLRLYFDVIWDIYEKSSSTEFQNSIESFIEKFKKAYILHQDEKIINFTDYEISNVNLEKILKKTNWDNITEVEGHKFNIIDVNKIYPYRTSTENEFEVYIFEDIQLFIDIYAYFSINLF